MAPLATAVSPELSTGPGPERVKDLLKFPGHSTSMGEYGGSDLLS